MASLRSLYAEDGNRPELQTNMNVDYVINYKIPPGEKTEAEAGFVQLIEALTRAGLATEVRNGSPNCLLIFIKVANDAFLTSKIYRERVQDWLYGVRTQTPNKDLNSHFKEEPITSAERLRLVYLIITKPKSEGGAGIIPQSGQWKHVESIFPLHNHAFNRKWIKEASGKYTLKDSDLDQIRDNFGEKVAFYFAFLQAYFTCLIFPATFGFGVWLIVGGYSWFYAVVHSLWTVVFFEYWKQKEVDLAVGWGVRGVSKIQLPRTQFKWDHEAPDPVTGEPVKVYSPLKRLRSQILQLPFTLICVLILGALYVVCFGIEIFLSELYDGPFKSYLTFLPTLILTALIPMLSTILTNLAEKLTETENYETHDAHEAALIQKIFVINFITSYIPVFLTCFLYMPFGNLMVPYLEIFKSTAETLSKAEDVTTNTTFVVSGDRLKEQIVYFTVTAQVINFATEVIVPFVKRKVFQTVETVSSEISHRNSQEIKDVPEEAAFLARVRSEAQLEVYDVAVDYREMIIQYGYLSMFSAVWPLTALSFLINNWVELRSDAMKIALSCKRPIPWRADSIGPWISALGFLSWMGSLVSAAIVFLFQNGPDGPGGEPWGISAWGLLLSLLLAEHAYLAAQYVVQYVFSQIDSPGLQKERAERFSMRKQLLQESLGSDVTSPIVADVQAGEKITREALEAEARMESIQGKGGPERAFWLRQQGMAESVAVGRGFISKMSAGNKSTKN